MTYEPENLTIYNNNLVSLNGRYVGRIDRDSYQMLSGVRGKTTLFTGKIGTFDQPHEISVPVYVPAQTGSVSDWKINPEFTKAVSAIVARIVRRNTIDAE